MPDEKKGTVAASCSYLWRFKCSVCGHEWTENTGSVHRLTGWDPADGEEIDCENETCGALLTVKIEE